VPTVFGGKANQPSRQALFVFTTSLQLLHMNQEAAALADHLNTIRLGQRVPDLLPLEVLELCHDVCRLLKGQPSPVVRDVQAQQDVADYPTGRILLRGLGLSDSGELSQARILIFVDRVDVADQPGHAFGASWPRFTGREQLVLEQVAKGLTNKEIASNLHIAEQTVKTHVKRLMQKLRVSTRTGIVARFFSSSTEPKRDAPPYSTAV